MRQGSIIAWGEALWRSYFHGMIELGDSAERIYDTMDYDNPIVLNTKVVHGFMRGSNVLSTSQEATLQTTGCSIKPPNLLPYLHVLVKQTIQQYILCTLAFDHSEEMLAMLAYHINVLTHIYNIVTREAESTSFMTPSLPDR